MSEIWRFLSHRYPGQSAPRLVERPVSLAGCSIVPCKQQVSLLRLAPVGMTRHIGPFAKKLAACVVVLCAPALTGCRSTPPPKPLAELTPAEQAGHIAFQANCGSCHYDRETGSLHGPSLLGVYKRPYLPSGAPANDDRIRATILHGRGNMPALGGVLDDAQTDAILLYLKTL